MSSKKTNGNYQLRRPNKTYNINLFKEFKNDYIGKYDLNLNYNYYGSHYDTHSTNFKTIKMNSTNLINLSVSKKINNNIFKINLTNLFNEKYQRPHGYSQDKRRLNLEFRTKF